MWLISRIITITILTKIILKLHKLSQKKIRANKYKQIIKIYNQMSSFYKNLKMMINFKKKISIKKNYFFV